MVHRSYRWKTEESRHDRCPEIDSIPFWSPPLPNLLQFIYSDALAFHACSTPTLSKLLPGPFKPDWPASRPVPPPLPSPPLLISRQTTYYDRETIKLDVKLPDWSRSNGVCPVLLEEVRDARGNVHITQRTHPPTNCHYPGDAWGDHDPDLHGAWDGPVNEFQFQTGGLLHPGVEPLGEQTITFIQIADGLAQDGELRLVRSNPVTLNIVKTPPNCAASDLEPDLRYYQAPGDLHVAAINLRNVTGHDCVLPTRFVNRWIEDPTITVNAHQTVSSSIRWRTGPAAGTCERLSASPFSVRGIIDSNEVITSPTLLPNACSPLQQTDYVPGAFQPEWAAATTTADLLPAAPILTAPKQIYDEGEQINWKVALLDSTYTETPCTPLLVNVRTTSTPMTSLSDEVDCHLLSLSKMNDPANQFAIRIPSGGPGVGSRTVTVFRIAGTAANGEIRLIPSNRLALQIIDPATIPRIWGEAVLGVRADATLDKKNYTPGEDVPLHLAFENVSAPGVVYPKAPSPCGDGRAAIFTMNVSDERGNPIPRSLPTWAEGYDGRCFPPQNVAMQPNKLVPVETSLKQLGYALDKPGIYTITVSWSAYRGTGVPGTEKSPADPASISKTPFATVTSAPLTIRIAHNSNHY